MLFLENENSFVQPASDISRIIVINKTVRLKSAFLENENSFVQPASDWVKDISDIFDEVKLVNEETVAH